MGAQISFDWYLIIIVLGVFQALFLSIIILLKSRKSEPRFRFLSLFIFSLALVLTEVFLDYSGYIMGIVQIDKFSFPVQFLIAPSLFLFIRESLYPGRSRNSWVHFIPFVIIFFYFSIYYLQDRAFKYNLHIEEYGLDLERLPLNKSPQYDPLHIHRYIHYLVFAHLITYLFFIWHVISAKYREGMLKMFGNAGSFINQYRNLFFYYLLALFFMAFLVFRYFWLGDFVFSLYLTAILYLISINISFRSLNAYYRNRQAVKYASSNLGQNEKNSILNRVRQVAEEEGFYCSDKASLELLAQGIKESKHNVSQVLNEVLGKSFFEYLAELRINKSKSLLTDPKYHNITIDEISFMVGYNSRSAFNRVFKSMVGTTPAEYRRKLS
jgi:AraC-like DNA-binding protein